MRLVGAAEAVDTHHAAQGSEAEQPARDANDCQFVAKQQTGYDPAMDTAKGAGTGAAVGAFGGAAVGGGYTYSKSKEGYEQAYATCMSHKGYQVRRVFSDGEEFTREASARVRASVDQTIGLLKTTSAPAWRALLTNGSS